MAGCPRWLDWLTYLGRLFNMCAAFVCACLYKTAYHHCITCTRYIKLLHTVEICKNTLTNACLIFIHTHTPHMGQSHVCQKAWYYHKWPTGLSWWCQIHPFLVEILLSNSMLREWPTGQSSCRIAGGVNPPQLLKSILRKYEVAQEESSSGSV